MAATETGVETYRNFIGGEWVDPAEGRTEDVINPATGEAIAQAPLSTAPDVDKAVAAARARVRRLGEHDARRARAGAAEDRRRDRGARGRVHRARGGQRRQAAGGLQERRDPRDGRQPALLRRRRAQPRGQGGGRVPGGLHVVDPPRAGRRRRPDRAVELPADDGDLEDRPGAGRRQHDRAQAGRDDAADHAQARRALPEFLPTGVLNVDRRPRRPGRPGARHPPRRRHGLAHRLGRHRQVDRRARRPTRSSTCTSSSAARRRW